MRSKNTTVSPQQKNVAEDLLPSFGEVLQRHQAGHLDEAERNYRTILTAQPNHADALHALGFIFHQRNQHETATEWMRKAVAVNPRQPLFLNNLGIVLHKQGKQQEAIDCYQKALAIQPDHHMALCNLGNALHEMGRTKEAIDCYRKALVAVPDFHEIHNNLGNALVGDGQWEEAMACYHQAIALKPDFHEAYNGLGTVLRDQGRLDESIGYFQKALTINPHFFEAHNNLGNALLAQGKPEEAIACYHQSLRIQPNYANAYHNLGNAYRSQGQPSEAITCFQKAIELQPNRHEVHNSLGNVLQGQGKLAESAVYYQQSLTIEPRNPMALSNLAVVFQDQGKLEESIDCYNKILTITPNDPKIHGDLLHQMLHTCDWRDFHNRYQQMITLFHAEQQEVSPFIFLSLPTTPAEQKRCAELYTRNKYPVQRNFSSTCHYAPNPPRLKIGYLSSDYQNHPVAYLTAELFELHDRNRFEIFAYSYGPDDGKEMRQRIMAASDHFVDLYSVSHHDAARRICDDGIHILIELNGFTKGARLEIAALKPAPIQASWLGYLGSMGAPFIDYIISDSFITPASHEGYFSEKILRLPECFQPNDRQRAIAERTPTRQERGLPEQGFIYASFNKSYKINPSLFDVWMRLLLQRPGSILWLVATNRWVEGNLRREAEARGVDGSRLYFVPRMPLDEYLANYRLVDLVLDTYPYNSGTTASNALWAGCPMLTYAGDNFVSRQAGSLLIHVGLPEMVTHSLEEYESLALALSADPERMAAIRQRLQQNLPTSPLFDSPRFTRHLESAYALVWERFQSGLAPDHVTVQPMASTDVPFSTQRSPIKMDLNTRTPSSVTAAPVEQNKKNKKQTAHHAAPRGISPPDPVTAAQIQEGLQHHYAGRLQEAETLYHKILRVQPNHPDALHLLGFIFHQRGQQEQAAEWIGKAVTANPKQPLFLNNLGIVLREQGKHEEAILCFQKALALQPKNLNALCNLGNEWHSLGQWDKAIDCYHQALAIQPDLYEVHNSMGNALLTLGKPEEAIACYQKALEIHPTHQNAFHNLGNVFRSQNRFSEAIECFEKALAIQPDLYDTHNSLGNTLQQAGRLEEAISCYQKAMTIHPNYCAAYSNMGSALQSLGKMEEALASYQKALTIDPNYYRAYNDMGVVLLAMGRLEEAIASYQKAITLEPRAFGTYNNLGVALTKSEKWAEGILSFQQALALAPNDCGVLNHLGFALQIQGKYDEAIVCYRRALEIEPDNLVIHGAILHLMQQLCEWPGLQSYYTRMMALFDAGESAVSPFVFLSLPTTAQAQRRCSELCIKSHYSVQNNLAATRQYDHHPERIKIGYLSCDFQDHATSHLMAELFELHDHSRFEIKVYSYGHYDGGYMRKRIIAASDSFTDLLHFSHQDAAQCILNDGVHILIELKGHTRGARMEIAALRPAPIQVAWVGYPGTAGASFIDYVLTDPFVTPHGFESHFTEKIVRLPGCYQPNDRKRAVAEHTPTRQECGLPEQGFLFASLNNSYKITEELFDIWMNFLRKIPDSLLWLIESNPWVANNLRREAEARGVSGSRLFFAPKLPVAQHLARYRLIDLALDTFPYTSHTTGSDALWVGCPLVACAGQTFASRVTGSLLHNVGLPELVTDSLADYETLVLELAADPKRLAAIRQKLQANLPTSSLFDSPRFTKNLESAFKAMWLRFQSGLEPDHIDVPAVDSGDTPVHTEIQNHPKMASQPQPTKPVETSPLPEKISPRDKPDQYYAWVNESLLKQIPSSAQKILDVGCGGGALGERVKADNPHVVYHGLELNPGAAKRAANRLDHVHCANIESSDLSLDHEAYDCILFGNVLEHLYDPLEALCKVQPWLTSHGNILCCVPNIQHHTILASLLSGDFQYQTAGLLDKTPIRFFTYASFIKLMLDAGLIPHILSTIRSAPSPEFSAIIQSGMVHLKQDPKHGLEYVSVSQYIFKGVVNPAYALPTVPAFPLSFICAATDRRTLTDNLLSSPIFQGNHPHQLILLEGQNSAAEALENGIKQAIHPYVVFVRQEVYLPHRWDGIFCQKVLQAEASLKNVGIFGVYGATLRDGQIIHHSYFVDRHIPKNSGGPFPIKVTSLDELLVCFRKEGFPGADPKLGHHLYATDLVCAYRERGQSAVVVDAICFYNSGLGDVAPLELTESARYFSQSRWKKYFPLATPLVILPLASNNPKGAVENSSSLLTQADTLRLAGKIDDALVYYQRILALEPNHAQALYGSAISLGSQEGSVAESLRLFAKLKELSPTLPGLAQEMQKIVLKAGNIYNTCLQSNDLERAANIIEALSLIGPANPYIQEQALLIFSQVGRTEQSIQAAKTLLKLNPDHLTAHQQMAQYFRQQNDTPHEIEHRVALSRLPQNSVHTAFYLQEIYMALSTILLTDLDSAKVALVEELVQRARTVVTDRPVAEGDALYHSYMFYRAAIDALDIGAVVQPTPASAHWPTIEFASSTGRRIKIATLQTKASKQKAKVVFFVAADSVYVARHAKRYVSALLKSCDVPCLIIIHVIGGMGRLLETASLVGIEDYRLVYSADAFNPDTKQEITWKVHDTSPIRSHLVYYQSARFLWLDYFLERCNLPVIVTDIDQLLQRGIKDMLERLADRDVVFHEAQKNKNMADRLIANLLMVYPTDAGKIFTRFFRHYLGSALQQAEEKGFCAYFLDQNALLMARHHVTWVTTPRLGYFDEWDINVQMFQTYQKNPFRFFSFYTGFDAESLPKE